MIVNKNLSFLFPVPVAEIIIEDKPLIKNTRDDLLNLCDDTVLEKLGNWCSQDDLHNLTEFKTTASLIDNIVKDYLEEIYKCNKQDFYLTCMWANIHKDYSKHHIHNHPNSFLSGVLYIDAPLGSGEIFFKDPKNGSQTLIPDYKTTPDFLYNEIKFQVSTGKLILFPSYLEHGTHLGSKHNKLRISISFNYMLKQSSNYLTYKF